MVAQKMPHAELGEEETHAQVYIAILSAKDGSGIIQFYSVALHEGSNSSQEDGSYYT